MTGPNAIVIREAPVADGPTRRTVYHKLESGAYERKQQVWRESIAGWHTQGTETIGELRIDVPDDRPPVRAKVFLEQLAKKPPPD